MSIITLLTDFGEQDYFVGAMKGVILSLNPAARIIDITHRIPPQDIEAAAFCLLNCYRNFPPRTIHVAVVDPGVGSDRRAIAIECANQFFVGPDNGLFSWICEREGNFNAFQLTNDRFFRKPVSKTFHGRDVFAPVAAHLSKDTDLRQFGEHLDEIVRLPSFEPDSIDEATIEGRIIHIDRFGNCVTNVSAALLKKRSSSWRVLINDRAIQSVYDHFAAATDGEIFGVIGSAGFLEICARDASAADLLVARRGQRVRLVATNLGKISAQIA